MGVTEAVKGASLGTMVADFPAQGEGLLAVSEGLVVGPEQSVIPASVVEGPCLAAAVTGGTEQGDGPQVVRDRLCEAVLIPEQAAEPGVSIGLADRVAQFREQVKGLPQVGVRLVASAKPPAGNADAGMRVSLA